MRDYVLNQAETADRTFTFPALNRIVSNWRKRRQLRQLAQRDLPGWAVDVMDAVGAPHPVTTADAADLEVDQAGIGRVDPR